MKRLLDWQVTLAIGLIALTTLFYYFHFLIFRDAHHIFLYFIGDVAFVFFEVLLVTLVIHRLLHHREQKARRERHDMLSGAFFSELGTKLLGRLAASDASAGRFLRELPAPQDWSESEFLGVRSLAAGQDATTDASGKELEAIRTLLLEKKQLLLDLLQNPVLLEDGPLTRLTWAVFHLAGELEHRERFDDLGETERERLREDMNRVYRLLMERWVDYLGHLKSGYPHLYPRAGRKNPFRAGSPAEP